MPDGFSIRWSPQAQLELADIHAYVARVAPTAATRLLERLVATAEALCEQPERGRPVSGGVRELASVRPYIIRHRVIGEVVDVVRIRHAARRPT